MSENVTSLTIQYRKTSASLTYLQAAELLDHSCAHVFTVTGHSSEPVIRGYEEI